MFSAFFSHFNTFDILIFDEPNEIDQINKPNKIDETNKTSEEINPGTDFRCDPNKTNKNTNPEIDLNDNFLNVKEKRKRKKRETIDQETCREADNFLGTEWKKKYIL